MSIRNYRIICCARLRLRAPALVAVIVLTGLASLLLSSDGISQAAPVDVGYIDYHYGSSGNSTPTGEKAESKLWYNDGLWWGSLYHSSAQEFRIYRFDAASQSWSDTGTALDDRNDSRADVLWDTATQKLYVVSHIFNTNASVESSSAKWGRLYRYSYNSANKSYSLDGGFPVTVTRGSSENLTIAKDSSGRLWVAYVEGRKVMVNHSLNSDTSWGTPYALPVANASVSSDDIAAVIAFQGNKIGVVWSNQLVSGVFMAIHNDGAADNVWQLETVIQGTSWADDHLNLKTDSSGRVFVAAKTSKTGSNPLIVLHVRGAGGGWTPYTFGTGADGHTRPLVMLDESNNKVHMFATSSDNSGEIYHKASDRNSIAFAPGMGNPFIRHSSSLKINNAASAKQNVTNATGLLVIASNYVNKYYYHNDALAGGGGTTTPTPTNTLTPTATATATRTPTPTATPLISLTPSNTPTASNTPTPSNTPTNTATPSVTPIPPATQTYAPSHDTQVKSAFPNSNYGTLDNLRLRLMQPSDQINSYLKFDVPNVGGPVTSATLRLYSYDGSDDGGSVYLVSNTYRDSSTPWVETGLNWNNAPLLSGAPLASAGSVGTDAFVDFDVSAAVTGSGTYSFGLSNTSSNSILYYSKESAVNPPQLILNVQTGGAATATRTPTLTATPLISLTPSNTPTPSVTPIPPATQTYAPSHDTQTKLAFPNSNYGTLDNLRLRLAQPTDQINSYLKFDVPAVGGPVTSATLRLYSYDGSDDGGSVYLVSNTYRDSSTPWVETGLNWNNAPLLSGAPLASAGSVGTDAFVDFDVSAAVTGSGTYSFGLSNTSSNSILYYSKESALNPPQLILNVQTGVAAQNTVVPVVTDTMLQSPLLVVESDSALVAQTGSWTTYSTDVASGGSYLYSSGDTGDALVLFFEDTQVDVLYVEHPALGSFTIEVDGIPLQVVDSAAATTVFGKRMSVTGLSEGKHMVRIYPVAGTVAIDAFAVEAAVAAPVTATEVVSEPVVLPTATATDVPLEISPSPTVSPVPVMLPWGDSFETGTNWLVSESWLYAPQAGYQGSGWFADARLGGQSSTLTSEVTVDLRTAQRPHLSFWHRAELIAGDGVAVDILVDDTSWLTIDQQMGAAWDWTQRTLDLTPYRNSVIRLRFRLDTATSRPETVEVLGYWLDELVIWDEPVPVPTDLPTASLPPTETETPLPSDTPLVPAADTETPSPIPTEIEAPIVTETPLASP